MKVPYINLGLQYQEDKTEILQKVSEVIDSGMFILGEEVKRFEETFAQICQTKYAVGVANGTDALMLALKSHGIGMGDEVITAPNSYLASASSIALCGATPVFADVRDDFNLDPKEVEKKVTDKTKAIIAVHLTGRPAEMDAINEIAQQHKLIVIEDAAQAVGATYKGKSVGGLGNLGCFSLHPLKNLAAAGDAGMITTDDEETYNWLLKARTHGMKNRDECEFWSLNSRIDALQAAILNVKVKRLNEWNSRRREIAEKYINALAKYVKVPTDKVHEKSVYHTFIIQTDRRDELQEFLADKGIDTKVHYPVAIHQQEAAKDIPSANETYPETERQTNQILSLPVYPELSNEQVNYVIEKMTDFFKK
jgi:dTDP-4-amino-4,6-dideoxygalactose transaminase